MARKSAVLTDESHAAAVGMIEEGLKARKTVRAILEEIRQAEPFSHLGKARLMKEWNTVWRSMVAQNGTAPLPTRGGRGAHAPKPMRSRAPRAASVVQTEQATTSRDDRDILAEMLDLVISLVEAPDSPARDAALRACPQFVRAVRSACAR